MWCAGLYAKYTETRVRLGDDHPQTITMQMNESGLYKQAFE